MPGNKKTSGGFTIVELVVAMSISAVVLATGYDLFTALRNTADRQQRSMAQSEKMMDALRQLREDLLHAIPVSYSSGDVFVGSNAIFNSEKFKILAFYSLCVSGYPDEICGVRQIYRIEYELVRENNSIRLYRSAVPVIGNNKSSDNENGKLIFDGIEHINVFFHNGSSLLPAFSSKQRLPVYVRFKLAANGRFRSMAIKLPCGTAERKQSL